MKEVAHYLSIAAMYSLVWIVLFSAALHLFGGFVPVDKKLTFNCVVAVVVTLFIWKFCTFSSPWK